MTTLDDLKGGAVQYRAASVEDLDTANRTLLIRAAPYEVEADIGGGITEVFTRGTFARAAKAPHRLGLWADHGGPLAGRAIEAEDRPDGFYMRAKVSDTTAGRDLLTQVEDGTLKDASIEFTALRDFCNVRDMGGGRLHVRHKRAVCRGAAIVFEGAYGDQASVVEVREAERERAVEAARLWLRAYTAKQF